VLLYAGGLLLAFYVFVSIFADNIESQARSKIFVLALAATLSLYGISISMPGLKMGLFIGCVVAAAVSLAGLIFWLKVTRMAALKITGCYMGVVLGYPLLVG
jgi:hypothetical protein